MKKFFILLVGFAIVNIATAQDVDTTKMAQPMPKKIRKSNGNSSNNGSVTVAEKHPADHFLIQFGSDSWINKPDGANTNGGKHFNFYLMTDKPFKTNPKFSVAYGLGIGSSNIYFSSSSYADIKGPAASAIQELKFGAKEDGNHFNKFKLTEIFLELPVEVRYNLNPATPNKSWKIALGAKVGTLLKAYTKGKDLQSATGVSLYDPTFIEKQYSKKFFNTTRLSFTGRVGYGNFSLNASYAITPVVKTGFASTDFNTLSIGLCIGGL